MRRKLLLEDDKRIYLYKSGNECINITGGWLTGANSVYGSNGYSVLERNLNNMTIKVLGERYGATSRLQIYMGKTLDLSLYSKFIVEAKYYHKSTLSGGKLFIGTVKNIEYPSYTLWEWDIYHSSGNMTYEGEGIIECDISNLNVNKSIYICMDACNDAQTENYIIIKNIWLEK